MPDELTPSTAVGVAGEDPEYPVPNPDTSYAELLTSRDLGMIVHVGYELPFLNQMELPCRVAILTSLPIELSFMAGFHVFPPHRPGYSAPFDTWHRREDCPR
jgi:hypothetical protein